MHKVMEHLSVEEKRRAYWDDNFSREELVNKVVSLEYELKDTMRRCSVDCLYNFLKNFFDYDPAFLMPIEDFKELYRSYRKANNEGCAKWNREHYHSTFQEFGIMVRKQEYKTANGKTKVGEVIFGIRLKVDDSSVLAIWGLKLDSSSVVANANTSSAASSSGIPL